MAAESAVARRRLQVDGGDTLGGLLVEAGLDAGEAGTVVASLRTLFDPRRLRRGQSLDVATTASKTEGDRFVSLTLATAPAQEVRVERGADGTLAATRVEHPLTPGVGRMDAVIKDSIDRAARGARLPAEVLSELVRVLSFAVDFQRDLRPGDRLEVVYPTFLDDDGTVAATGAPLFVRLSLKGREIVGYRHTALDGRSAYYDEAGRPLRKQFLLTPVDGARISSTFGLRRHPVLGYTRMHRGIDFAAPPGTPIFAAGEGTVVSAGRNKGYGLYVRLHHGGGLDTAYGHMLRIAAGLRPGQHVAQGDVIGRVGATGLATGPHLHYEILRAGVQIDPQSVRADIAAPLGGEERRRFFQTRREVDRLRRGEDLVASGEG